MIGFRPATRSDLPAVIALLAQDALGKPVPAAASVEADFDAMVAAGNTVLYVGDFAGQVVACYQLSILRGISLSAPLRGQIEGVRVRGDLRGQGLGAALLADAEARARAAGAELLQLTSDSRRDRARAFYERRQPHRLQAAAIGAQRR